MYQLRRADHAAAIVATRICLIATSVGNKGQSAAAKQAVPTAPDQVASIKPDFPERIAQNQAAAIASDRNTTFATKHDIIGSLMR